VGGLVVSESDGGDSFDGAWLQELEMGKLKATVKLLQVSWFRP